MSNSEHSELIAQLQANIVNLSRRVALDEKEIRWLKERLRIAKNRADLAESALRAMAVSEKRESV